ncbi:hypothetical protein HDU78_010073 [Chytriomyces hyalinus]|nr:hypothetical protein HDU78_010073 [Chytriomyces hyalinus]
MATLGAAQTPCTPGQFICLSSSNNSPASNFLTCPDYGAFMPSQALSCQAGLVCCQSKGYCDWPGNCPSGGFLRGAEAAPGPVDAGPENPESPEGPEGPDAPEESPADELEESPLNAVIEPEGGQVATSSTTSTTTTTTDVPAPAASSTTTSAAAPVTAPTSYASLQPTIPPTVPSVVVTAATPATGPIAVETTPAMYPTPVSMLPTPIPIETPWVPQPSQDYAYQGPYQPDYQYLQYGMPAPTRVKKLWYHHHRHTPYSKKVYHHHPHHSKKPKPKTYA